MAMLWEYPAQWQRAGAVSALVVPARTRRAAALAVGLLERYEWISANRQTLAQRTPAAPMIPHSLGLRLPAAVTRGATKAHDEVLQRTQVPPRPGSHQRLLARCSLRTPPCGGYKCRRAFCDDKHDLFDVDPTNNIQARRLCIAVSYSRLNAALNKGWKIGYVRQQSAVRTPRQSGYGRPRRPISWMPAATLSTLGIGFRGERSSDVHYLRRGTWAT
jgi:hypothetical protein